mgnify:CR=1 FL=1|tara:strand:- start:58819 stop:59046 length:228 start_codon:yes stop_codon:yes gene_type:complete
MSNKNSLPQSIVSIKVAHQHARLLVDSIANDVRDIEFDADWATISWTAIGGVEELELVEAIKESGAGEPKVTELS